MGLFDRFNDKSLNDDNDSKINIDKHDVEGRFEEWNPYKFEELIKKLFVKKGYSIKQEDSDVFDIIACTAKINNCIIIRRFHKRNIEENTIRKTIKLIKEKEMKNAKIVFITTSDFTDDAKKIATENNIDLWNWDMLKAEILKHVS